MNKANNKPATRLTISQRPVEFTSRDLALVIDDQGADDFDDSGSEPDDGTVAIVTFNNISNWLEMIDPPPSTYRLKS